MIIPYDAFPLEIFEKIAYYLSNRQRGVCQSVCRSWRKLFTPPQYRHIYIKGKRQFNQFYQALQFGIVGYYVKRLSVEDVFMSPQELESLPRLCPNLVAFCYNGTLQEFNSTSFMNWKSMRRLTELQNFTITNHSLSTLTHLSLRFSHNQEQFFAILPNATQLINLSLDSVTLSLSHIESIHQSCPSLQKLKLINAKLIPIASTVEEKRSVATYPFQPAKYLKTFEYQNGQDLYDNYEWLYYFSSKYIYLENLMLWCEYSVYTQQREIEFAEELDERYAALARIGMNCQQLKSLQLLNVTMNHWIFEMMDSVGTTLENIGLSDMTDNTIDMLLSLSQSKQNVSSLTLWGWPSLCIQDTLEETMIMLSQCSNRLSCLTLSMQFSGIKNAPIPIDSLLSLCPNLTYLKLFGAHPTVANLSTQKLKLKHFIVENGCFKNNIFEFLAVCCSELKSLEIVSCALVPTSNHEMQVTLHMPNHQLHLVRINHIRPPSNYHHEKSASDFRYAHTNINNNQQLFELADYEPYYSSLAFDYEQKLLEAERPTRIISHGNTLDLPTSPLVYIQCQRLDELYIGDFLATF